MINDLNIFFFLQLLLSDLDEVDRFAAEVLGETRDRAASDPMPKSPSALSNDFDSDFELAIRARNLWLVEQAWRSEDDSAGSFVVSLLFSTNAVLTSYYLSIYRKARVRNGVAECLRRSRRERPAVPPAHSRRVANDVFSQRLVQREHACRLHLGCLSKVRKTTTFSWYEILTGV